MFRQIIALLTEIRDIDKRGYEENKAWIEHMKQTEAEDVQRHIEHLAYVRKHEQETYEMLQRFQTEAEAYARGRDEAQTRIMQENLTVLQERLAIEKTLMQEAQPIDKQAIYNEMERERKARARDKKAKEESTTNETV